ncbi:MAG TPA: ARMT1-like domain-containing protein, partial [Clostridia bacterium]|nr:ARMT1-like domain-containing protein [Clostridia bacterium]
YADIKARDISQALKLEPTIRRFADRGDDPLLQALKIAATGNIMDSALYSDLDIESCVSEEMGQSFAVYDRVAFDKELNQAKTILIIADNAGEVVFDKVLVEYLSSGHKVTYAVRGTPIINDATVADALKTGISEYADILSTGCGMPGAVLESCGTNFQQLFHDADLVISKGQGNFEALSDAKRSIYFLLKAKCDRIAQALDVGINDYVFKKSGS